MTVPVVGHVIVLGYLATVVAAGIENAILVGGLSALGAALYSIGVPSYAGTDAEQLCIWSNSESSEVASVIACIRSHVAHLRSVYLPRRAAP